MVLVSFLDVFNMVNCGCLWYVGSVITGMMNAVFVLATRSPLTVLWQSSMSLWICIFSMAALTLLIQIGGGMLFTSVKSIGRLYEERRLFIFLTHPIPFSSRMVKTLDVQCVVGR